MVPSFAGTPVIFCGGDFWGNIFKHLNWCRQNTSCNNRPAKRFWVSLTNGVEFHLIKRLKAAVFMSKGLILFNFTGNTVNIFQLLLLNSNMQVIISSQLSKVQFKTKNCSFAHGIFTYFRFNKLGRSARWISYLSLKTGVILILLWMEWC